MSQEKKHDHLSLSRPIFEHAQPVTRSTRLTEIPTVVHVALRLRGNNAAVLEHIAVVCATISRQSANAEQRAKRRLQNWNSQHSPPILWPKVRRRPLVDADWKRYSTVIVM